MCVFRLADGFSVCHSVMEHLLLIISIFVSRLIAGLKRRPSRGDSNRDDHNRKYPRDVLAMAVAIVSHL